MIPMRPGAKEEARSLAAKAREGEEIAAAALRTTPVVAHCPTCGHEWHVCYLPMPLEQAAGFMKAARCPKGCSAGPRVGSLS